MHPFLTAWPLSPPHSLPSKGYTTNPLPSFEMPDDDLLKPRHEWQFHASEAAQRLRDCCTT